MMLPSALLVGVGLLAPIADKVPALDVEQICAGIAQQGGTSFRDPDIAVEKKNCLESERAIHDQLVREWPNFAAADKAACTNEATMGGESSYTELLTCLEMARDVRTLHNEQQSERKKPSGSAPTPVPAPSRSQS